ncbi:hypothetical protein DPMN_142652 [Dreissena polymorpha]|uniref:Uncharacterized protein n=1 Tax=Dreissena polymorpha TaxID=45954 RepID=A0A9D4JKY9_DREPO|nr:hypothetical protein DPMN_142652 [Dreissena polymorpha]
MGFCDTPWSAFLSDLLSRAARGWIRVRSLGRLQRLGAWGGTVCVRGRAKARSAWVRWCGAGCSALCELGRDKAHHD